MNGTPPQWAGVVRIERPKNVGPEDLCRVISARTLTLNGKRAISEMVPYRAVRHVFKAGDKDYVSLYAEFRHGVLELHERADFEDFFNYH